MDRKKSLSRIRVTKLCLDRWAVLVFMFLVVSCTATIVPTTELPTTTPRVEVFVVSTFTPGPAGSLDLTQSDPAPAVDQPTPTLTPLSPVDISQDQQQVYDQYTVEAGDALINLALEYDVPIAAFQLANDLGDEIHLKVGQILNIPRYEEWEDALPYWTVYVVKQGETISEIAKVYGLSLAEVVRVNRFAEADLITVGQPIILPLEGPAKVAAAAQVPFPTPELTTATPPSPTTIPTVIVVDTPTPESQIPTESPPVQTPSELSGDTAAMRIEIYRLLNEQRALYNLPTLAWSDILASAAQKHADDCFQRGWCGHTGSDGSLMKTRIIREGYDPVRWSECWAWYGTPTLAVTMWMDEVPPDDAHRRTILSTYLTEVGVGVVPGNGHGYYFIADFGTPRQ